MAGSDNTQMDESQRHDFRRKRRGKNIALAIALFAWVALIWVITMVNFDTGG